MRLSMVLASLLLVLQPPTAWAGDRPLLRDLLKGEKNEMGFSPSDFLVVDFSRPFSVENLMRVDANVHRVPPRGLQLQLFKPGSFGLTVHYRW